MTDATLQDIRARLEKITADPWDMYDQAVDDGPGYLCYVRSLGDSDADWIAQECQHRDAVFIANAPHDIRTLLDAVATLTRERDAATVRATTAEAELEMSEGRNNAAEARIALLQDALTPFAKDADAAWHRVAREEPKP